MVVDLRLDQELADLLEQQTEPGDAYIREVCRAYLGCYYMSSMYDAIPRTSANWPELTWIEYQCPRESPTISNFTRPCFDML